MREGIWTRVASLALAALIGFGTGPASAGLEGELLARWYALLGTANGAALSGLMASNAKIQLADIGVTQTKQQFVGSMDEFAHAIQGGSVRYKLERESANAAVALVCYHFASEEKLTRESFTFARGLVSTSVQHKIADSCSQLTN